MNDNSSDLAVQEAAMTRRAPRMPVNIPCRVRLRAATYPASIQNVSCFGAFVSDVPPLRRGTEIVLEIALQRQPDLSLPATVVYWRDGASAQRAGTRVGAGLKFHAPADIASLTAAMASPLVESSLAPARRAPRRLDKPTIPMPDVTREQLVSATESQRPLGRLVLAGDLDTLGIADVLSGLARLRMSGWLEITHDDLATVLYLCEGDIFDVESSHGWQTRATQLFELLSWRTGTFRMLTTSPKPSTLKRLKVSQLLMDFERARRPQALPEIPGVPR